MKILIRLPNWLGDVVMSAAFVNAVHGIYPHAVIDVIVKTELAGIAEMMPALNARYLFSKNEHSGLTGVYRFGKKLSAAHYDLFFNLPSSLSSVIMAWATGAEKRIGFKGEGGYFFLSDAFKRRSGIHRVDEYISLLEQFAGKKIKTREVKLDTAKPKERVKDWVVINFNSEAPSRRMPLDTAKTMINLLTNTFKTTAFTFIGSKKEADFINQVIAGAENQDRIENFTGRTDLITLAHLMAACTVVLTTDSGPAHLANSVGAPVVVLFGAGNEHNTAPYNKQNLTVLRYGKLDCEPCVKNTCQLYGVPKCMQLIDEMNIINALSVYLPHA